MVQIKRIKGPRGQGPGRPKLSNICETERIALCVPKYLADELRAQAAKQGIKFSKVARTRLSNGSGSHGKSA